VVVLHSYIIASPVSCKGWVIVSMLLLSDMVGFDSKGKVIILAEKVWVERLGDLAGCLGSIRLFLSLFICTNLAKWSAIGSPTKTLGEGGLSLGSLPSNTGC